MNWKEVRVNNMKTFILKWGKGSVLGIQTIYKTMSITAENIDDSNPLVILPDSVKRKVYYVRIIHASEKKEIMIMAAGQNLLKQKK